MKSLVELLFALSLTTSTVAAEPALAGRTADYRLAMRNGLVERVEITPIAGRVRFIADRFVSSAAFEEAERMEFRTPLPSGPSCRASYSAACAGTCSAAARARPFTRLRAIDARSGRTLWTWRSAEQPVDLLSGRTGECLSPDGRALTVIFHTTEDVSVFQAPRGFGVLTLSPRADFATVVGRVTGEEFGHKRFTGVEGWRRGRPATLVFSVNNPGEPSVIDQGDVRPRRSTPEPSRAR